MPTVNKSAVCRRFGWTRHQFDAAVLAGMPVVIAAVHKGAEWAVDLDDVEVWRAARDAAEAERRRRYADALAVERARQDAAQAEREAAERERRIQERRAEERRYDEVRRLEEERVRQVAMSDCYSACRRLALADAGLRFSPGYMDRPEFKPFLRDWPSGRPDNWLPPPGMLQIALEERKRDKFAGEPEYNYRPFVPRYVPGQPWPWRVAMTDA